MKSHITVVIDNSVENIEKQLRIVLEPHRLDEDNPESIKAYHFDYWHLYHSTAIKDEELAADYPAESIDILYNSRYIRNLPKNYTTSGVISADGSWADIRDFGWSMINEPSTSNEKAMAKWKVKLQDILAKNINKILVEVLIHC